MFATPDGNRRLKGHEKALVVASVVDLHSRLEAGDAPNTGVEIFDRMETAEKIFALAYVLVALTDDSNPVPSDKCAWVEGTIYAIYRYAGVCVHMEIEDSAISGRKQMVWRTRLAKAVWVRRVIRWKWSGIVEDAADKVILHRDFENDSFFGDLPPDLAARHRKALGIPEHYFSTAMPLVTKGVAERAAAFLDSYATQSTGA